MAATEQQQQTNQRSPRECPSLSARTQRAACSCHLRFALLCFALLSQVRAAGGGWPVDFFYASKLVVDLASSLIDRWRRATGSICPPPRGPGRARDFSLIPSDPAAKQEIAAACCRSVIRVAPHIALGLSIFPALAIHPSMIHPPIIR
jgi:hypothetical protein